MIVINGKPIDFPSNLTNIEMEVKDFKDIKKIMRIKKTKFSKAIVSGDPKFIGKCMKNNDLKRDKFSFMTF